VRWWRFLLLSAAALIAATASTVLAIALNVATGGTARGLPFIEHHPWRWTAGSTIAVAGAGLLVWWTQRYYERRLTPPQASTEVVSGKVVVGDIPQEPPGFQPRADLLAELERAGPGVAVVRALTGMRGVGKTQLVAAYARGKLAQGWRLVAWVNAEGTRSLLSGLAAVAEAAGLSGGDSSREASDAGMLVRHHLETNGELCLIVFDNTCDPDVLRPFLPGVGAARVLITSDRQSVANLGASVLVDVFTAGEALTFLADRTGIADAEGAAAVARELGYLPLALAQAAAVISGQRLTFEMYLNRLRSLPVEEYLIRGEGQPYSHGVAEAILMSLDAVQAGDQGNLCIRVMEFLAVLSTAGVRGCASIL
jgi:hypothetical protein